MENMQSFWVVGQAYDLKNDWVEIEGKTVREIYLEMDTAEAKLYDKITGNRPFIVERVSTDGVTVISRPHDDKTFTVGDIREYGWEVATIFPHSVRGFFEEVDMVKVKTETPVELPPLKEEKRLTPDQVESILNPELFKMLRGLWTVSLVPTELGRSLNMNKFVEISDSLDAVNYAVSEDIQRAKKTLRQQRKDLEKQLKETKALLSTFA